MLHSKKIGFFLLPLWLLAACAKKEKADFAVTVSYQHADKVNLQVPGKSVVAPGVVHVAYLQEVPYGMEQPPVLLDSVNLNHESGTVKLVGKGTYQNLYELIFGDNAVVVPMVNDTKSIEITVDFSRQDGFYHVNGSPASSQLQDFVEELGKKNFRVEKDFAVLDSLKKSKAPDSLQIVATNTKNHSLEELNAYLSRFINTNAYPAIIVLALNWASRSMLPDRFDALLNNSVKKFPAYTSLQNMQKSYQLARAQQEEVERKESETLWVSKQLPSFTLPDTSGKPISLENFKGRYMLVDFWASWCAPCRAENPNIVRAYEQFKGKNFTIVGVSLDRTKGDWLKAIHQDSLYWTQISDLKFWSSKAVDVFKFNGIPYNILVDPSGHVIAERLRGSALQKKLNELFP